MTTRKLTRLYVEQFKKLTFIDIALGNHVTEISGKNESGKSTAFDAIDVLLDGLKSAPAVPINKDADRALIRGTLGDLIVERTFRRGQDGKILSDIVLRTPDGAKFPAPQRHLDQIKGEHILDPMELIDRLLTKPVEVLRRFVDIDFDAIDRANLGDFDRRTEVNRLAKESRGAASLIIVPANTPDEPVDDSALVDELQTANDHNALLERRKTGRDGHLQRIDNTKREAALLNERALDLRRQADELEKDASSAFAAAATLQKQYDEAEPLPPAIDVTEIRTRIAGAKEINAAVAKRTDKAKHEHIAIKYEREAKDLTERIDGRKQQMRSAIAEAKFPIDGIGLADGMFMLNDLPFSQASRAGQLRTAFALIVASDPAAELRLAWFHDAAVFDDDTLADIDRLAQEFDVQCLLETIRPNSANAIVLEDGHVKGVEPPVKQADETPALAAAPSVDAPKLDDEFALTAPTGDQAKKQPRRRPWTGPGAPTGDA